MIDLGIELADYHEEPKGEPPQGMWSAGKLKDLQAQGFNTVPPEEMYAAPVMIYGSGGSGRSGIGMAAGGNGGCSIPPLWQLSADQDGCSTIKLPDQDMGTDAAHYPRKSTTWGIHDTGG